MRRNEFTARPAVIVGNGPSLKLETLSRIRSIDCFGMNRLPLLYNKTGWRPTFYLMVSTSYTDKRYRADYQRGIFESPHAIVWKAHRSGVIRNVKNIIWVDCYDNDIPEWDIYPLKRVCKYGTSAYPAIQIADYLGFSPIYLLGMDGYIPGAPPTEQHFDANYSYETPTDPEGCNDGQIKAFLMAKQHCKAPIYDVTEGKGLGIFEKRSVEEILDD